jgi:uncharacterized protein
VPIRPPAETRRAAPPPWVWSQRWSDLLFLHWRVPARSLRDRLPPGVEAEEYDGAAWVSLVLFRLKVRPRWLPFVPGLSTLTEANLRTYVRAGGMSGIYFLSIFADNPLAVRLARLLTPLPYRVARMSYRRAGGAFRFERGADGPTLEFRPSGGRREPDEDSLDAWLLERYRAFARTGRDGLTVAEVEHPPWRVAEVEFILSPPAEDSWLDGVPARPPDAAHYADGMDARFGAFRAVAPFRERGL